MASSQGRATNQQDLVRPTLSGGDEFFSEIDLGGGGGGKKPVQTMWDVRARLGRRSRDLAAAARERTSEQLGPSGNVVLEATVLPNYLAASDVPTALMNELGVTMAGTRPARGSYRKPNGDEEPDREAKTYLLAGPPEAVERLAEMLDGNVSPTGQKAEQEILQLDDLHLGGAETVLYSEVWEIEKADEGRLELEAVLHPQIGEDGEPDDDLADATFDAFVDYIDRLGGSVNAADTRREGGLTFTPLLLPPESLREAALFTQLRVLRPMPAIAPAPPEREGLWTITGPIPGAPASTDVRIAIFDGGLTEELADALAGLATSTDLSTEPALPARALHGGAVTSAALFGAITPDAPPAVPPAIVDAYRVWPMPGDRRGDGELTWVLEQIEAVLDQGDHRIAVICLGPSLNVSERHEPHLWTATLDRIAWERDVLICVAVGNTGQNAAPADRVLVPSDLVNGLGVGACLDADPPAVRSDYSSVGPGRPGARVVPTVVQFGGDLAIEQPFGALVSPTEAADAEGTSLAAPVVARTAAEILRLVGSGISANALRGLVTHMADRPSEKHAKQPGSTSRDIGYGRVPIDPSAFLDNDERSVTIVYETHIMRGQELGLQLPFPDELFSELSSKTFALRWTLSFFSDVEPANPVDYATSGLEVTFRPHSENWRFTPPEDLESARPLTVNRLKDQDLFDFHLREGWKRSSRPVSGDKRGYAPEVERRSRDGKWETLVRVDRPHRGVSLHRPMIDLRLLTRAGGVLKRDADVQPLAVIVTLVGPKGSDVYARTREAAPALVPLVASIPTPVSAMV